MSSEKNELGENVEKIFNFANIAMQLYSSAKTGKEAIEQDNVNDSKRNTLEMVAHSSGAVGGAMLGSMAGASLGSAIGSFFQSNNDKKEKSTFEQFCTGAGSFIGSLVGSELGSAGLNYIAEESFNAFEYGIVKVKCQKCYQEFIIREYKGEKKTNYCKNCTNISTYK